ncbi:MAG TPA: dihydrolipoyl dehydrogenase [Methanoculleus sp.]|nr:dihydrolipoyl dehydrogenase [Methanoculleus sp.]
MGQERDYDVVVIGSGAGSYIAGKAAHTGHSVALIEKGPLGGTCPNSGCIPSKMIFYPAEVATLIREAEKVGIHAEITGIDVALIFERMRRDRERRRDIAREWTVQTDNLDFFEAKARFVGERTLQAGDATLTGEKVFNATGARPAVPPIEGLDAVEYLTNETALELSALPESIIIVGGGYVAIGYAHFFSSLGTATTVIQRNVRILPEEEPWLTIRLTAALSRRIRISTGIEVASVEAADGGVLVRGRDQSLGEEREFSAERLMIATGRRSNADTLDLPRAGIETDDHGFVATTPYLETSAEGVWAIGDANGKGMFRHAANREARLAWHNATRADKIAMDYRAVPHAVFCYPPVASVGLSEEEARQSRAIRVGRAAYLDTAKGIAMAEETGMASLIVDAATDEVLGFHIVGPGAPEIIQEVVNVIARRGTWHELETLHIHPALSEVVQRTVEHLDE